MSHDSVEMCPVLIRKGRTKVALYGLGEEIFSAIFCQVIFHDLVFCSLGTSSITSQSSSSVSHM